jgi:hypothetical protein
MLVRDVNRDFIGSEIINFLLEAFFDIVYTYRNAMENLRVLRAARF